MKDTLFGTPRDKVSEFVFDSSVAKVFDDMIARSVPLYQEVQTVCARIVRDFAEPNAKVYDLGCSSGTTLRAILEAIENRPISLIGVDNSEAMLESARTKLSSVGFGERVELMQADLQTFEPEAASVILVNYTLQFIPPDQRQSILRRLHQSLLPGGIMLLTEKIRHADERIQNLLNELHWDFKRRNGYSELEIAQKRDALENVLVPLTVEQNCELLHAAGFKQLDVVLKWYNFASIVAIKG